MEPGSSTPGGARGLPRTAAGNCNAGSAQAPPGIEIILADPAWHRILPRAEALARRAAQAALCEGGRQAGLQAGRAWDITVLLTDDRELRRLNGEHRGRDKPTNVLSFPGAGGEHLGDIALALGMVRREAAAAGKRPATHFAHLVAHGALHLLGYDHQTAGEARQMERAESRVLHRLRLPNPWGPA